MRYNLLGNTGLWVSELCFGAMTFGGREFWSTVGQTQQQEANDQVAKALEHGINFFDTANVYSYGLSEEILGKALGDKRQDVVLATKARGRMGPNPNQAGLNRHHLINEVEASLKRMNTDYIDLFQVHGPDQFTPLEETLRALDDLVRAGKIRYIGASNLMAWSLMKALGISALHDWARFESLQAYYSIAGRDLERELAPLLKDQKLGLLVWSPLAGGFLSGKFRRDQEPEDARRTNFDFPPVDKERAFDIIEVMDEIAANHQASVAQIALAWLLHQDVVTSIIIGAKRMDQLEANLAAVDIQLEDEELQRLNEVSDLPSEYPGWMQYFMSGDIDPNEVQQQQAEQEEAKAAETKQS
jgi:aryl-alcohol dehydrogenase-like predicted oxidoreductase